MGVNFPSSPTIDQLWPQPAVAGLPVYRWDGEKWTTQGGIGGSSGGGGASIYVQDTAPTGAPDGALWWASNSGLLYIRYNDGTGPSQWVVTPPSVSASALSAVTYAPQTLTIAQQTQARQNIGVVTSGITYGALFGLTLSAGGSTTFVINAGTAADSTNSVMMTLPNFQKTTAAWAVGSNNGALDVGTVTANTWYHVYLIMRSDTGVVDVCFSTQPVAPNFGVNVPVAYNRYRRIGAMRTNASLLWTNFVQIGDKFLWNPALTDYNAGALSLSVGNLFLSVPSGVSVTAQFYCTIINSGGTVFVVFASPLITLSGANTPIGNISLFTAGANLNASGQFSIETNTSSQVQMGASGAGSIYVVTQGWIDRRGRDA